MLETKFSGQSSANALSFLSSLAPVKLRVPPCTIVVRRWTAPSPSRFVAMAVKRSPKRLKYSALRLTKEDELLLVEVDPSGADTWKLDPVVELLKQGAVGVIPTDTVPVTLEGFKKLSAFPQINLRNAITVNFDRYAIACHLKSHSAIERLHRIKNIEPSKDIDTYTTGFPRGDDQGHTNIFRAVKHCLPGPYTFILTASKELPKQCVRYGTKTAKYANRKSVGIRMPDDAICQAILEQMDAPLICTSVKWPKENEWMVDSVVIADIYGPEGLDFVVDGGVRIADPSTVVDMTEAIPKIIRQGKGPRLPWMEAEDDNGVAGAGVNDLIDA